MVEPWSRSEGGQVEGFGCVVVNGGLGDEKTVRETRRARPSGSRSTVPAIPFSYQSSLPRFTGRRLKGERPGVTLLWELFMTLALIRHFWVVVNTTAVGGSG